MSDSPFNEFDDHSSEGSPIVEEGKKQFSPKISFFHPKKEVTEKSAGSAFQADYSAKNKCIFVAMSKQIAKQGEKKVFDWEKKATIKLDQLEMAKLIGVFSYQEPIADLIHENKRGDQKQTTTFKAVTCHAIKADLLKPEDAKYFAWAKKLVDEGKMNVRSAIIRLAKSSTEFHMIILQPHEVILAREFFNEMLKRSF